MFICQALNPTAMRAVTYNFFNQPTCVPTTANIQLREFEIENACGRNIVSVNINEYFLRFLAIARNDGRAPLYYERGGRRGGARYYRNASVFRRRACRLFPLCDCLPRHSVAKRRNLKQHTKVAQKRYDTLYLQISVIPSQ